MHAVKLPASSLHSKLAVPAVPLKLNDAESDAEGSEGSSSIVVSGADVSIVHVNESGVGSALPAPSIARTRNVWLPSARPV